VRIGPLDELDDLPPPAPLPLIRFCGARGCKRRARPGGRHWSFCHAAAVWHWREDHRRELTVRRRDAAAVRGDDARARDSARAKLALRRGALERGRCRECGVTDVIGLIADPARWREAVWVCREHRVAELERRRENMERRAYQAKQAVCTTSGRRPWPQLSFFRRMSRRGSAHSPRAAWSACGFRQMRRST